MAVAQAVKVVREVAIQLGKHGHQLVGALLVGGVLREHHDVLLAPGQQAVNDRHAVASAAVEQLLAVDIDDLADQGHRRRRDQVGKVGVAA